MHKFILSATLLLFAHLSYGQDQWLVTAKLDTIYGDITLQTGDQYKADEVKIKDGKDKNIFKSYHIRSVHLAENKEYEVLKIDERYQFVLVDLKGKYFSQYYYLDPSSTSSTNYALKILVNWEGQQYKVSNLTSRKKYATFFEACESVSEKILSGEFKKRELDKIFAEFDSCIDEKNNRDQTVQKPLPISNDIEAFISELKAKELYQGDLSMMINDINQKLLNQQEVPKYLQQAVLEQLGDDVELKSKFSALLEN
ncbi:MAG: hypothetical protein ABJH98_16580 [Reichenbachiella sp.]|uniref:hypothetical protein n=1 Tax=Reichenbachiella sp. TaxID=2184521 RepID=UPI00329900EB